MMYMIEQAGFGAYVILLMAVVALVVVATFGRKSGRPGSVAAAWAVAVLACGAGGFAMGTAAVRHFVNTLPADQLAKAANLVATGTSEAAMNLALAAMASLAVLAVGGVLAILESGKGSPK